MGSRRAGAVGREYHSFDEYFPHYVSEHSRPATRWLHFAGTHVGAAAAAVALVRRRPAGLLALPLISYGVAWGSHFAIERNRPATFGHPLWSLRGDLRMIGMMWQGRDDELIRIVRDQMTILLDGGDPNPS
ncbi:MAG: DUF962 domain-containing protein [Candidatus Dormibacteria bacterium]